MKTIEPCQLDSIGCSKCLDRQMGWFCSLGNPALIELENNSTAVSLPARTAIFEQGRIPPGLYIVCGGYAKLSVTGRDGQQAVVGIVGPGSVLGLFSILAGREYEVSAKSLTPVRLRSIKRDVFVMLLHGLPEIQQRALKSLCDDYMNAHLRFCRIVLPETVDQRLVELLTGMGRELDRNSIGPERRIPMLLTQSEIATMIGSTRETVSRSLSVLQKRGVVTLEGQDVVLRENMLTRDPS